MSRLSDKIDQVHPALRGQIRTFLAAIGGGGISTAMYGWIVAFVEPFLGFTLGLIVLAGAAFWSWKAKQPASDEAQVIAAVVAAEETSDHPI